MADLILTSPAFSEGGWIPVEHTGRGADLSPELRLSGLIEGAKTLAVTLDDASHPFFPNYNHWVIWNLPAQDVIPAEIPHGKTIPSLGGAVQGRAYGRHRYRGPCPPSNWKHTYVFTVYALDCSLPLGPVARRKDLKRAMEGHVLQTTTLSGVFQSRS